MRKIYLVPNFVTTAGMLCGFYSIVHSIQGELLAASWAIVAAGIFDLLDGRVARLAKATSSFGVQYDSLADLISFGMAPAVLLYQWGLEPYGRLGVLAAFLFLACGALRLARFNVKASIFPKKYFQGMPIPVAAGVVSTLYIFRNATGWPEETLITPYTLAFTLGLGTLMVSSIPFPSFKELNWRSRSTFSYLLIGVLVMILIAAHPELTLFLIAMTYVGASLIWAIYLLMTGSSVFSTGVAAKVKKNETT